MITSPCPQRLADGRQIAGHERDHVGRRHRRVAATSIACSCCPSRRNRAVRPSSARDALRSPGPSTTARWNTLRRHHALEVVERHVDVDHLERRAETGDRAALADVHGDLGLDRGPRRAGERVRAPALTSVPEVR